MPLDPAEILADINPEAVPAAAPPDSANYRDADIAGICCANCAKFVITDFRTAEGSNGEVSIPTGVCSLWEAKVDGVMVSDGFTDPGPSFDSEGNEVWDFADNEDREVVAVHLAVAEAEEVEEEVEDDEEPTGFVIKEVLRTGEWPVIPTRGGQVRKPLKIVRDGRSSKADGVIAMEELVENFKNGPIKAPQIPLSDDSDDHKNITRVNTGFVRDLWIEDKDGGSVLKAKMEFTEPDVKDKVLRGTYTDVSCGIPWTIRSRGESYGSTLEHVAITNRPFIDGLGPFLALSDQEVDVESVHFGSAEIAEALGHKPDEAEEDEKPTFSAQQIIESANAAFTTQLGLPAGYKAVDLTNDGLTVANEIAEMSWKVPFEVKDGAVVLSEISGWNAIEDEGTSQAPAEQKPAAPRQPSINDDLEAAQRVREIRLSNQSNTHTKKEDNMPLTREELDALSLSDEQRAAVQKILDENVALSASAKESETDKRVAELEGLGLKERPGFLKLYRQVMLSDDGGPAVVLLSDTGSEKEPLTAKAILDRAIDALTVDGKVVLSDQHLMSGNDEKPPADVEGEVRSLEERLAEAKTALGKN